MTNLRSYYNKTKFIKIKKKDENNSAAALAVQTPYPASMPPTAPNETQTNPQPCSRPQPNDRERSPRSGSLLNPTKKHKKIIYLK
jgi:hypothetical protein